MSTAGKSDLRDVFAALLGPEPQELCPAEGCVVLPETSAATVRPWRVDDVLLPDVTCFRWEES